MINNIERNDGLSALCASEQVEFGRFIMLTFVVFFVVAAVTRILPPSKRPLASSGEERLSIYREAMQAAHNVVPFLFMR